MTQALNILIAEDDPAIALVLKTVLSSNFDCQLHLAKNGNEGLKIVNDNLIHIILSDWNMPEKTGKEFLSDIRSDPDHQHIPFIMLTARADKESVIQAAKLGITSYIHKPFNRSELIEKIENVAKGLNIIGASRKQPTDQIEQEKPKRDIVQQIVEKLKNQQYALPVLSDVAVAVSAIISDHSCSVAEIVEVIKTDAVVSAKLIALANSPVFRQNKQQRTLEEAITRIGLSETENYIWVFANQSLYESSNTLFSEILHKTRQHALATAECARLLAVIQKLPNAEELYYVGLIHDIGDILVMRILEDITKNQKSIDKDTLLSLIHKLHSEFGSVLLKRWNMPEKMQMIVRHHESIEAAPNSSLELKIVYLADQLAQNFGYSLYEKVDPHQEKMTLNVRKQLSISNEQVLDLQQRLSNYMAQF